MTLMIADGKIETKFGEFRELLFYDGISEAIAIVKGDVEGADRVLCRVHSHCIPAHLFNSIECDCREQMEIAQMRIQDAGAGIIIWLDQEGKGNGHMAAVLSAKLRANGLAQTEAYEALGYPADARRFSQAAQILKYIKVNSITLMTNNPAKAKDLTAHGINVAGTAGIQIDTDNPLVLKSYSDKIRTQNHSITIG